MQLKVIEQYEGGNDYTQDEWTVDCSAGSITTQPILRAGTYRIALYGIGVPEDMDAVCTSTDTLSAAIEEVSAEAGGTLSVSLDLSPDMGE